MQLLKYKLDENAKVNDFNISYNSIMIVNNKISISVKTDTFANVNTDYSKDIDIENEEVGLYDLLLAENTDSVTIKLYPRFKYVSKYSDIISATDISSIKIGRLYIAEIKNDSVLLLTYPTDMSFTDFSELVIDNKYSTTKYLTDANKDIDSLIERYKNKSNMINNIDPYDSISYLEAQVDLLTRVLLNTADSDKIEQYKKDLEEFDKNSVLDIKNNDQILKENINKENVRKYQAQYIAKKNTD